MLPGLQSLLLPQASCRQSWEGCAGRMQADFPFSIVAQPQPKPSGPHGGNDSPEPEQPPGFLHGMTHTS
jgi:hypothetical protein